MSDLYSGLQGEEAHQYRYAGLAALMIEYGWPRRAEGAAALADARRTATMRHPWAKGIRLRRVDRLALGAVLAANAEPLQTARQVADIDFMDEHDVLGLARRCMHAQNRRAKHHRSDRVVLWDDGEPRLGRSPVVDQIYALKHRFLHACVEHGRSARVEHFIRRRRSGWECLDCERDWGGSDQADMCYSCGEPGLPLLVDEHWFIVDLGGAHRFHQPGRELSGAALSRYLSIAVEVESHDPDQPVRDVPYLGLSDAAQLHCIQRAIDFLTEGRQRSLVAR